MTKVLTVQRILQPVNPVSSFKAELGMMYLEVTSFLRMDDTLLEEPRESLEHKTVDAVKQET